MLGRGGFGAVYRAFDERNGLHVALKILHRSVARDPALLDRFLREARTTSAADNPHVVRVIDAHEELDGVACIAFELLTGETLDTRLRREGALSPNEAVDLAVQILDGLEVAHERGIVHRDVKPANLFLVDDGLPSSCVKILDFGIGRLAGADAAKRTETGMSLGSPFYMAPEQVFDSARADARADLYGVAVCLYRMLSSALPHGDGPATAWMTFVATGGIASHVTSPYGALPEPLVEAVALGLSPRPDARWQNAAAFSSALLDSLPSASAPTRVTYEPAAVLRSPVPARVAYAGAGTVPPKPTDREPQDERVRPSAARTGRHPALELQAVSEEEARASAPPAHEHRPAVMPELAPHVAFARHSSPLINGVIGATSAPQGADSRGERDVGQWAATTEQQAEGRLHDEASARAAGPTRRAASRFLLAAAVLSAIVLALALLVGAGALAFVAGEIVGRRDARVDAPAP